MPLFLAWPSLTPVELLAPGFVQQAAAFFLLISTHTLIFNSFIISGGWVCSPFIFELVGSANMCMSASFSGMIDEH